MMNDVLIISESDQREERERECFGITRQGVLFIPVQAIISAFADRNRFMRVAVCTT
jgi:hypothetical protein